MLRRIFSSEWSFSCLRHTASVFYAVIVWISSASLHHTYLFWDLLLCDYFSHFIFVASALFFHFFL